MTEAVQKGMFDGLEGFAPDQDPWDNEEAKGYAADEMAKGSAFLSIGDGDVTSIFVDPRHPVVKEATVYADGREHVIKGDPAKNVHVKAGAPPRTRYTFLVWIVQMGKTFPKVFRWNGKKAGRFMTKYYESGRQSAIVITRDGTGMETTYQVDVGATVSPEIIAQINEQSIDGVHPLSPKACPELWDDSVPF